MTAVALIIGMTLLAAPPTEPGHASNPLYHTLRDEGWTVGKTHVAFPAPAFSDGMSADEEQTALRAIAGSDREVAELTRDSVTAPFVLRTHDLETEGGVIRQADLWFVVRARLDDIAPEKAAGGVGDGPPVEAGNMRFRGHRLSADEVEKRGLTPTKEAPTREWYVHMAGRLLDRLQVEATDRITASRTDGSWVFAARTDPKFDQDEAFPNRWRPIARQGGEEKEGTLAVYAGGASYVKIVRLATVPGALLIEAHFAFDEPKAWFDGAPILRSKIALVAQDRVRGLRRELAKSRKGQAGRSTGEPAGEVR
jgi:hypothetical protein